MGASEGRGKGGGRPAELVGLDCAAAEGPGVGPGAEPSVGPADAGRPACMCKGHGHRMGEHVLVWRAGAGGREGMHSGECNVGDHARSRLCTWSLPTQHAPSCRVNMRAGRVWC